MNQAFIQLESTIEFFRKTELKYPLQFKGASDFSFLVVNTFSVVGNVGETSNNKLDFERIQTEKKSHPLSSKTPELYPFFFFFFLDFNNDKKACF